MSERRGHWYLLTGFALGLALGLLYAWLIDPLEYVNISPATLREVFKDQYRALIASAFAANGNLPRAQSRLALLGDADTPRTLAEQAQRMLAADGSAEEARALGLLAVALGRAPLPLPTSSSPTLPTSPPPTLPSSPSPTLPTSPSPPSPSPTLRPSTTPTLTMTPLPTRTLTPTVGAPLILRERIFICDLNLSGPLIQVIAQDALGQPLPGVESVVNWEGGEDHFFTGLKPELGSGYADFTMTPGILYTLRLAESAELIADLTPAECETATGSRYWGSWLLIFRP